MRVIDTPNVFIKKQQPENEKVIISLRGIMDEIMCMIAPDIYQPRVQLYRGNKVFYVQSLKYFYGELEIALLLYKNMSKYLVEQEFTLNPYEIFVPNKIINGHKMTVFWHVNDMNISQKIPQEVPVTIEFIKKNLPR